MPPDPPRWLLALSFEAQLTPTSTIVEHSPPLLTATPSYEISESVLFCTLIVNHNMLLLQGTCAYTLYI